MAAVPRSLQMPNPSSEETPRQEVEHNGVVVIVGANGSGKSRLGTWLENPETLTVRPGSPAPSGQRHAYRIGAQRSLLLPEHAARISSDQATATLTNGGDNMIGGWSRVQGDPVVGQTNDFSALVNALFAEHDKLADEYYKKGKVSAPEKASKDSLDRVKDIWSVVFPERSLDIGDHSLSAKSPDALTSYPATNLSDGERVGFYLIGHALMAPKDSCIVIDEPELHLHPSIQARLWDSLERVRADCTFVYITHDLAFAASRSNAPIIVLFDYIAPTPDQLRVMHAPQSEQAAPFPGHWRWQLAPRPSAIPSEVSLQILGSRRPTLFVEGNRNSLDLPVYEALFPEKLIVPAGNCDDVARATYAFRNISALHHMEPRGLIDRDDRDEAQVGRLLSKGIYTLPVGGVENLLALPEAIRAFMVSAHVPIEDQEQHLGAAQGRARRAMVGLREKTIAERAQYTIRRRLQSLQRTNDTLDGLKSALDTVMENAQPEAAFAEAKAFIDTALDTRTDFKLFLTAFRNKGILCHIASEFHVSRETYKDTLVELLQSDETLRLSIRQHFVAPLEQDPVEIATLAEPTVGAPTTIPSSLQSNCNGT